MKATELLQKILDNQHVSRWDVYHNRTEIIQTMKNDLDKYEDIYEEVIDIIESAKESL